jgi:nuclear pore complex protein Nup205
MLVSHTLKRSAGIGADEGVEEGIEEVADGLMVIIAATGFLEVKKKTP